MLIDSSTLLEEEILRGYRPERYYPVQLGEVFESQYRTIGKLGYGSASTVWLCRDLNVANRFVALKVYVNSSKMHRELDIYKHLSTIRSIHAGRYRIRKLLDFFEIDGPNGTHICLVHEPMGISFDELRLWTSDGLFNAATIRQCLRPILEGLQFLHKEAHIIHTDLQPNNMLLGIHDPTVFNKFEAMAAEHPVPRKVTDGRTIYSSQAMPLTKAAPSISDFSEARFGGMKHSGTIMPHVYRAPEVILDMPWDHTVDIWSFGMTVWDLFEPKRLFPAHAGDRKYSECHHLAQMVAILGPPPLEFLQRSAKSWRYWDENGQWKGEVPIPEICLAGLEQRLVGLEKEQFLDFMRKMLKWKPEDRSDCQDVYFDQWLLADLIESGEIIATEE